MTKGRFIGCELCRRRGAVDPSSYRRVNTELNNRNGADGECQVESVRASNQRFTSSTNWSRNSSVARRKRGELESLSEAEPSSRTGSTIHRNHPAELVAENASIQTGKVASVNSSRSAAIARGVSGLGGRVSRSACLHDSSEVPSTKPSASAYHDRQVDSEIRSILIGRTKIVTLQQPQCCMCYGTVFHPPPKIFISHGCR